MKKCIISIFLLVFLVSCTTMENLPHGEFIESSCSPNQHYVINAYLCSGNATTDFSIRCEVVNKKTNEIKNIYWEYGKETVNIEWVNEQTVLINGKQLDVTTDIYDWRTS